MKKNIIKLLIPLFLFFIISIMSIYSAESLLSESYNDLYIKQILWYIFGFIIIWILYKSKNNIFIKYSNIFYYFGILMLILVLIFGNTYNGSKCWFSIPGLGNIQPSEFVKIFLILKLSNELNKDYVINNFKDELKILFKCFIYTLIPSILTFLEPDTGIVIIYFVILFVMLFIYGIRIRWFIVFSLLTASILVSFLYLYFNMQEKFIDIFGTNFFYRIDRLLDWSNNSGMQLTNALAAIGSAGIYGHGYNNTPIYIPEIQTDFIFSIFSSNFGLIGSIFLIIIIIYFDIQLIKFALKTNLNYKYIISGILAMLLFQQIENIGMNIGLLPITGITLPFISYGGSSLISYLLIIGIIINILKKELIISSS